MPHKQYTFERHDWSLGERRVILQRPHVAPRAAPAPVPNDNEKDVIAIERERTEKNRIEQLLRRASIRIPEPKGKQVRDMLDDPIMLNLILSKIQMQPDNTIRFLPDNARNT